MHSSNASTYDMRMTMRRRGTINAEQHTQDYMHIYTNLDDAFTREDLKYDNETIPAILHRGSGGQTDLPPDVSGVEDIIVHHETKI